MVNKASKYLHWTLQWCHNGAIVSQINGVSIACSTLCSGADQRKHQSSASLASVTEIHRWPVDSPHKEPVARKMFPLDDVIMNYGGVIWCRINSLFWLATHKTSTFLITGPFSGETPRHRRFPWQRASNAASVSIAWRHCVGNVFWDNTYRGGIHAPQHLNAVKRDGHGESGLVLALIWLLCEQITGNFPDGVIQVRGAFCEFSDRK